MNIIIPGHGDTGGTWTKPAPVANSQNSCIECNSWLLQVIMQTCVTPQEIIWNQNVRH